MKGLAVGFILEISFSLDFYEMTKLKYTAEKLERTTAINQTASLRIYIIRSLFSALVYCFCQILFVTKYKSK